MNLKIHYFLLFFLIPSSAIIDSRLTILLVVATIIFSLQEDKLLIGTIVSLSFYNGLMQFNHVSNARFIVEPLLFCVVFIRVFYCSMMGMGHISLNRFSIALLCLITVIVLSVIYGSFDKDFFYFGLAIKDFIMPYMSILLFMIFLTRLDTKEEDIIYLIRCFIFAILVVAILSLLNYIFSISNTYNRFVIPDGLSDEKFSAVRNFGGISVVRMQSVFGLSTQGAASCLYGIAACILLTFKSEVKVKGFNCFISLLILFIAGFISGSFTFYFTILIFLFSWTQCQLNPNLKKITLILTPLLFLFLLKLGLTEVRINNDSSELTLLEYAYSGFLKPSFEIISDMHIKDLVLGIGPYPKFYWLGLEDIEAKTKVFRLIYDNYIFGMFFQVGLLGFFLCVLLLFFVVNSLKSTNYIVSICCCSLLAMLGFAHGIFILDKLFIASAMIFFSILSRYEK